MIKKLKIEIIKEMIAIIFVLLFGSISIIYYVINVLKLVELKLQSLDSFNVFNHRTMKNIFYILLAFLIFSCGPNEDMPMEQTMILTDQLLTIESHLFGDVSGHSYDETLDVIVTNDSLFVDSEDEAFKMIVAIESIQDSMVSPSILKFPRISTGGPPGQAMDCVYYPCENYNISFTEMDFDPFGVIEGSIFGRHESNPEEVQILGSFKLQID